MPPLSSSPSPKAIKEARKQFGLTQTQAAKVVGYSLRSWQSWELGETQMRQIVLDVFIQLADCISAPNHSTS